MINIHEYVLHKRGDEYSIFAKNGNQITKWYRFGTTFEAERWANSYLSSYNTFSLECSYE